MNEEKEAKQDAAKALRVKKQKEASEQDIKTNITKELTLSKNYNKLLTLLQTILANKTYLNLM